MLDLAFFIGAHNAVTATLERQRLMALPLKQFEREMRLREVRALENPTPVNVTVKKG